MDFLEDLRMQLLNFKFTVVYIIHKILVWLNYLKANIFECIFKYNRLLFLIFFSQHIIMENLWPEQEKNI